MKKLLLLFIVIISFSCSKEEQCREDLEFYKEQYEKTMADPRLSDEQATLITKEYMERLENICN